MTWRFCGFQKIDGEKFAHWKHSIIAYTNYNMADAPKHYLRLPEGWDIDTVVGHVGKWHKVNLASVGSEELLTSTFVSMEKRVAGATQFQVIDAEAFRAEAMENPRFSKKSVYAGLHLLERRDKFNNTQNRLRMKLLQKKLDAGK